MKKWHRYFYFVTAMSSIVLSAIMLMLNIQSYQYGGYKTVYFDKYGELEFETILLFFYLIVSIITMGLIILEFARDEK